jgi:phosphohistidine phosphatase
MRRTCSAGGRTLTHRSLDVARMSRKTLEDAPFRHRTGLTRPSHERHRSRWHTGRVAEHTLILLRHSKSDWAGDEADIDRPLAHRGRRQAPEAGHWLATHVDRIDLAVVSTARRARETWDLVSAELGERPETRHDEDPYAASGSELLHIVRSLGEELATVVLVGHNPGLEDLAETLIGDWIPLPTSALAVIELDGPWRSAGRAPELLRAAGRPPTA